MRKILLLVIFVALPTLAPLCRAAPAAGFWWNPAEPGRGFVIETQGTSMFMAGSTVVGPK